MNRRRAAHLMVGLTAALALATGCSPDDDRWSLGAVGDLKVDPAGQLATLGRIRTVLQQRGWEITDDSTFADGTRGKLSAIHPSTSHTTVVTTTVDRQYLAVSLGSPCHLPAPGENPLRN
ncbi:hypothetical protein [Actinoplanes rectilineatus]|uniref:hypothetical protein n=1 Tax=Actinoplanes rectilineatus TaxID=113571 RepID=UPI000AF35D49|nr:hypothetical protein [Actinoplanes rectilineatus]